MRRPSARKKKRMTEFGTSEAVSAFVGASLAFAVDWVRAKQDRHREEADTANCALLSLAQMYTNLQNLWNQIYAKPAEAAKKSGRLPLPQEVRAIEPMPEIAIALDVPSLSFLLRSRDPDLPNRLSVVVSTFRQHLLSEASRTELHLEMQSKMEAARLAPGMEVGMDEFTEAIGPKLWAQLVSTTSGQVENIPKTIADIVKVQQQTLEVLKWEFPSRQFAKFQPRGLPPGENLPDVTLRPAALWRRAVRRYFDWLRRPPRENIRLNH
jgi:hypothetical protein